MPKIVDHEARRAELALASYRLLCERGYDGASMRQMAKAAGVSTGTLYHYFPDKSSILVHAFQTIMEKDEAALGQVTSVRTTMADRMRDVVQFVRNNQQSLTNLIRLAQEMERHEPEHDTGTILAESMSAYRAAVGRVVDMPDGPIVDAFISMLVGVLIHDLLDPQEDRLDHLEQAFVPLLEGRPLDIS